MVLNLYVVSCSRCVPMNTALLDCWSVDDYNFYCRKCCFTDEAYNAEAALARFFITLQRKTRSLCCLLFKHVTHVSYGVDKPEWWGYPKVKKFRRYVCSFLHDPRTWQTDTHRDTAWRLRHGRGLDPSMGWIGLGWVGLGWVENFPVLVGWVGLGLFTHMVIFL